MTELFKKRMLSYSDIGKQQIIIINPFKSRVVTDQSGHAGQNMLFKGDILQASIQGFVYLDEPCWIVFPRISFQTMIFNHFDTRTEMKDWMRSNKNYEITFRKKNRKTFVVEAIIEA